MSNSAKELTIFIAFFVLALAIRIDSVFDLTTLTHDGSIAYSAAAGQHNALAHAYTASSGIYLQWTPAKEWKRFLFIENPFCFGDIQAGLKQQDIHPSLYFWLLHVWMLIFGTHAWTGPLLNTGIACCSALVLFFLARECFGHLGPSLAASLIWFASPSALAVTLMPRPYSLMALLGLILIWRTITYVRSESPHGIKDGLILGIVSALGLLTHFYFALWMAGCALWMTLHLPKIGFKRWWVGGMALAIGLGFFLLIFGNPLEVFARAKIQRQPFAWSMITPRLQQSAWTLSHFAGSLWGAPVISWLMVAASLGLFMIYPLKRFRFRWIERLALRSEEFPLFFFLGWITGITLALYLAFLSPMHAMQSRYLSMTWPFLALASVALLRYLPSHSKAAMWGFTIFLLLSSATTSLDVERVITPTSDPIPTFDKAEAILIDMPSRGFLLPVVFRLKDDHWIFLGKQEEILANRQKLSEKTFRTLAFYNYNDFGNRVQTGQEIVDLLQNDYLLTVKGTVWGNGHLIFGARSRK